MNRYEEDAANQWETRFGARVDVLAAFAYLLGPISGTHSIQNKVRYFKKLINASNYAALICLILETHNDYVRFHGQSPLVSNDETKLKLRAFSIPIGSCNNAPSSLSYILLTSGPPNLYQHCSNTLDHRYARIHGVRRILFASLQNTYSFIIILIQV